MTGRSTFSGPLCNKAPPTATWDASCNVNGLLYDQDVSELVHLGLHALVSQKLFVPHLTTGTFLSVVAQNED